MYINCSQRFQRTLRKEYEGARYFCQDYNLNTVQRLNVFKCELKRKKSDPIKKF